MTRYRLWKDARFYCPKLSESAVYDFLSGKRQIEVPYAEAMLRAVGLAIRPAGGKVKAKAKVMAKKVGPGAVIEKGAAAKAAKAAKAAPKKAVKAKKGASQGPAKAPEPRSPARKPSHEPRRSGTPLREVTSSGSVGRGRGVAQGGAMGAHPHFEDECDPHTVEAVAIRIRAALAEVLARLDREAGGRNGAAA